MSAKIEQVVTICEKCIQGFDNLLTSFEGIRTEGLEPGKVNRRLYPEFNKIYREFYESFESIVSDGSEEWYLDDLSRVLADLLHVDYGVSREMEGGCEFMIMWDKCIKEWREALANVVAKLRDSQGT